MGRITHFATDIRSSRGFRRPTYVLTGMVGAAIGIPAPGDQLAISSRTNLAIGPARSGLMERSRPTRVVGNLRLSVTGFVVQTRLPDPRADTRLGRAYARALALDLGKR